jgi:hypothetical protein
MTVGQIPPFNHNQAVLWQLDPPVLLVKSPSLPVKAMFILPVESPLLQILAS